MTRKELPSTIGHPCLVAVGTPAVTRELVGGALVVRSLAGSRVARATTVAEECRAACMSEGRNALPTHERRAVRAITEAEDVCEDARALLVWIEESYADGTISAAEVMEGRVRIDRLNRNAQESVIAAQWTDAGERRAWGELADGPTPRLEHYERQILHQADEIGYELGKIVPFPTDRVRTNTA